MEFVEAQGRCGVEIEGKDLETLESAGGRDSEWRTQERSTVR